MTKKQKHPGGRPTEYNAKYHVPWAQSLAREGKTHDEIAEILGINRATFYRWKEKHQEFCDAINEGREATDAIVEDSLYKRAIGGKVKETRKIMTKDEKDGVERKHSEIIEVEREVLPDTAAAIFWLKNRQPDKWRDKREYEHTLAEQVIPDELSAELEKLAGEM